MGSEKKEPVLISVDIETTGSQVGLHSMYQIGACLVDDTSWRFMSYLQPISRHFEPEALQAVGADWETVAKQDKSPLVAMREFCNWVQARSAFGKPVFVGFAAAFDWKFVDWYFLNFIGENPFGHAPLDIKSFVMGALGCDWQDTKMSRLPPEVKPGRLLSHDALDDAIQQAEIFNKARAVTRAR